jgi:hypothetical protein
MRAIVEMNLALAALLVTPPGTGPRPRCCPLLYGASVPVPVPVPLLLAHFGRHVLCCIPFFALSRHHHHYHHRSARAPSLLHPALSLIHRPVLSCPSYTRSLTRHNLLFRHFPFSRQPSHTSSNHPKISPPSRRDSLALTPVSTHAKHIPPLWEQNLVHPISSYHHPSLPHAPTLHGDCLCLLRPNCDPIRPSVSSHRRQLSTGTTTDPGAGYVKLPPELLWL